MKLFEFKPKLVSCLKNYSKETFMADLMAGIIVGIVALPLAIAFGIASADQEKEHAKRMFKFLEGGMVEITASYPAGVIGTTLENLRAAAAGEHEEWSLDYPHFADVAEQEGFPMIAAMYRNISIAEKGHEERYLAFVNNIENMTVFAKEGEVVWQCRNCGYITVGKEAPEVCPACLHPQAYFEVKKENY